jgi:sulfur carrier protein
VNVIVNGAVWDLADGSTVADVLARLGAAKSGVAVARGGEVVPRVSWAETVVHEGDEVEVLTAVQGG